MIVTTWHLSFFPYQTGNYANPPLSDSYQPKLKFLVSKSEHYKHDHDNLHCSSLFLSYLLVTIIHELTESLNLWKSVIYNQTMVANSETQFQSSQVILEAAPGLIIVK